MEVKFVVIFVILYVYSTVQHPQSNVLNTLPLTEAQPQFAAYRQDVHPTGSPQHLYHPHPAATAAAGADSVISTVQTVNSIALPAQNLL